MRQTRARGGLGRPIARQEARTGHPAGEEEDQVIALMASLIAAASVIAVATALAVAGFRAGDRPEYATVTAVLRNVPHPDGYQRVAGATVRNPGSAPVLVGLSVYRSRVPAWLGAGMTVTVPHRTGRRRYRPGAQATVGVVGPGESACWPVPVPGPAPAPGRRFHLAAIIGQSGRRLRVITLPVSPDSPSAAATAGSTRPDPLSWLDDSRGS
jgi:hypothetical protein